MPAVTYSIVARDKNTGEFGVSVRSHYFRRSRGRATSMRDRRCGGKRRPTGAKCIPAAGHVLGDGFSCQADLMERDTVWGAMAAAYTSTQAPLAERMMAALDAAEAEGGDIRGRQSAAMLIVSGTGTGKPWEDRLIDLRVEDSPELRFWADVAMATSGDLDGAARLIAEAAEDDPRWLETLRRLVTVDRVSAETAAAIEARVSK